jgi:surface antigen
MVRHRNGVILLALALAGCGANAKTGEGGGLLSFQAADGSTRTAMVLALTADMGKVIDDSDRVLIAAAQYEALEQGAAGASRDWQNPANGHAGTITPGPTYSVNQYSCRDFSQRVIIGERSEVSRATACRQPDGTWRPIS